jgi:hypothetical protein
MKKILTIIAIVLLAPTAFAAAKTDLPEEPSYVIVRQSVVFGVSPAEFRRAMDIFSEKYPKFQCWEWSYNFNSQKYSIECLKGDDSLKVELAMDGAITVSRINWSGDSFRKKIGIWR